MGKKLIIKVRGSVVSNPQPTKAEWDFRADCWHMRKNHLDYLGNLPQSVRNLGKDSLPLVLNNLGACLEWAGTSIDSHADRSNLHLVHTMPQKRLKDLGREISDLSRGFRDGQASSSIAQQMDLIRLQMDQFQRLLQPEVTL